MKQSACDPITISNEAGAIVHKISTSLSCLKGTGKCRKLRAEARRVDEKHCSATTIAQATRMIVPSKKMERL
jgi:hypothetical protein